MIETALLAEITGPDGKKELLVDRYIEINKLRDKWVDNPLLKGIDFKIRNSDNSRIQDSVLGNIVEDINKNYLKVGKPDKDLSIIQADIRSKDEYFAKAFNNQIVRTVNEFYIQTKTKKSLENVSIIQQNVDSVRAVLNNAIYSAAAVADATPNLNVTRQVQRQVPVERSQITTETSKAVLSELVKNLELSKLTMRKETPLIQVVDEPTFPLKRNHLSKVSGILIGGFLAGFITCLVLIIKRVISRILMG